MSTNLPPGTEASAPVMFSAINFGEGWAACRSFLSENGSEMILVWNDGLRDFRAVLYPSRELAEKAAVRQINAIEASYALSQIDPYFEVSGAFFWDHLENHWDFLPHTRPPEISFNGPEQNGPAESPNGRV